MCACLSAQVNEWVKKRLEEKFTPLQEKPESVKQDLEKLQEEVALAHTHTHLCSASGIAC